MYTYRCICLYIHMYIHMCIHMYIERERDTCVYIGNMVAVIFIFSTLFIILGNVLAIAAISPHQSLAPLSSPALQELLALLRPYIYIYIYYVYIYIYICLPRRNIAYYGAPEHTTSYHSIA